MTEFLGESLLFPIKRFAKHIKNFVCDTPMDVQFNMKLFFNPQEVEEFGRITDKISKALKATKSEDQIILTTNEKLMIKHVINWTFDEYMKDGERKITVSYMELQSLSKIRYRNMDSNILDLLNDMTEVKKIMHDKIDARESFPSLSCKLRKNLDLSPLLKEFSVKNLRIEKEKTKIEIWDKELIAYDSVGSETIQIIKSIFLFT